MIRKYKFTICRTDDGVWEDLDDVIAEYGIEGSDEHVVECFEVEVEAENWKQAREKILIAAEALRRSGP